MIWTCFTTFKHLQIAEEFMIKQIIGGRHYNCGDINTPNRINSNRDYTLLL